jgi:hypothetical protein
MRTTGPSLGDREKQALIKPFVLIIVALPAHPNLAPERFLQQPTARQRIVSEALRRYGEVGAGQEDGLGLQLRRDAGEHQFVPPCRQDDPPPFVDLPEAGGIDHEAQRLAAVGLGLYGLRHERSRWGDEREHGAQHHAENAGLWVHGPLPWCRC